jgi:hypothetical protein
MYSRAPSPRALWPHSLSEFGRAIAVRLQAHRVRNARVGWLNERWFLERGIDVIDPANRSRVCDWFLREYAFAIPGPRDPPEAFLPSTKFFYADRYGGAGIGGNGGSGRTAFSGSFQVKGIGATPLVGPGSDAFHSHGCLTLEEGAREIILSEVAGAEFPYGALPAVMMITTDIRLYWTDDTGGEQRVLLIRPCVVRAGHMEPALFFIPKPFNKQHHLDDVERVRCVVRKFTGRELVGRPPFFEVSDLRGFAARIGTQMAFAHVHRLFHGPYASSNVGINGELIDFGGSGSLPNWEQAVVAKGQPSFGGPDWSGFLRRLEELCFYVRKYGSPSSDLKVQPNTVIASATEAYNTIFRAECLRLFGIEETSGSVSGTILAGVHSYFSRQQHRIRNYSRPGCGRPANWLWPAVVSPTADASGSSSEELQLVSQLRAALHSLGPPLLTRSQRAMQRLLPPRATLYRENIQRWIYDAFPTCDLANDTLAEKILRYVSKGRRIWRQVPSGCSVVGHALGPHNAALYCIRDENWGKCLLVEAAVLAGTAILFGQRISMSEVGPHLQRFDGAWATFAFPIGNAYQGELRTVCLGSREIAVPAMDVLY